MAQGLLDGVAAEEVAGKHGFHEPDPPPGGFFLMADPGGKSLEPGPAQVQRREVLALGTGAQTSPTQIVGVSRGRGVE